MRRRHTGIPLRHPRAAIVASKVGYGDALQHPVGSMRTDLPMAVWTAFLRAPVVDVRLGDGHQCPSTFDQHLAGVFVRRRHVKCVAYRTA